MAKLQFNLEEVLPFIFFHLKEKQIKGNLNYKEIYVYT